MTYQLTLQQMNHLRLTGMADALTQQLEQPNTYIRRQLTWPISDN